MSKAKHASKWTRDEVFDLCDKLLFEGSDKGHPKELADLLHDAGSVLMNREITLCMVRNEIGDK